MGIKTQDFAPSATLFASISISVLLYLGLDVISRIYGIYTGPLSKFPGPKLHAFSRLPQIRTMVRGRDYLDMPALHQQYGEVVRIGPNELSFQGSAQVWKDVHGFRKGGEVRPWKDPEFYGEPLNNVPGIITADDKTHARQRKIVSHAFSDKALKDQEPMLKHWAGKLRDRLAEHAKAEIPTDMVKMLNCTTFDVMADLTFAEPLHMLDNSEYVPWVKTIFASIRIATFIRAISMFNSVTKRIIKMLFRNIPAIKRKATDHWQFTTERVDRRLSKTPDRPDLWSSIIERSKGTDGLSLQEHYSIASLFMIAGTETTATALSGTLYYLLTNPQYLKPLQKHLRSNFSNVEDLTLEALQRDKQLNSILNEGLRMYSPVPIGLPRVSPPGGVMIAGHFVPEKTKFMVHNMATYRAESNFKHAYQFRPERWMGDEEFKDDHLDALEPFSVGPRNCIGKNLAWHEMRLLLVTILIHFDFNLCEESKNWADQKVYTLWEKHPLMCSIEVA